MIRADIGLLTETPGLYPRLNAEQNLGFYARLHGVENIARQVRTYLTLLGLWERRHEPVGGFSKGMQQKLAIARALLHEPPVLFLDEPTSALDPEAARVVRDFIETLRGEGRTIFICTHNLDEADRLCDRVAVIRQRLIRVDTPEALRRGLYGQSVMIHFREVFAPVRALIEDLPFVRGVSETDEGLRVAIDDPETNNPALIRVLVGAGADIRFVERESHSLELLVGKVTAAVVPAVILAWLSFLVTAAGMYVLASPVVFAYLVRPVWTLSMAVHAPLFALLSTSSGVIASSRMNDPRAAQQISALFIVPVVAASMAVIMGRLYLSLDIMLWATAVMVLINVGVLWLAVRLFQREMILTRWK